MMLFFVAAFYRHTMNTLRAELEKEVAEICSGKDLELFLKYRGNYSYRQKDDMRNSAKHLMQIILCNPLVRIRNAIVVYIKCLNI